jgi:hypothetical protein
LTAQPKSRINKQAELLHQPLLEKQPPNTTTKSCFSKSRSTDKQASGSFSDFLAQGTVFHIKFGTKQGETHIQKMQAVSVLQFCQRIEMHRSTEHKGKNKISQ